MPDPQTARAHEVPSAPSAPLPAPGWRKRHPVLARVLLYAVLLGVLVIPAVLWVQGRERYLWSRVEQISVEISIDPSGGRALKSLDDEFSEWGIFPNPALSDPLRARAERLRGVVARLTDHRAEMDRAFAHARDLDPAPTVAAATRLEWAKCLIDMGDLKAAKALLAGPRSNDLVLGLWHELLAVEAAEPGGADAQRLSVEQALAVLPRPLPKGPEVWFLLAPWRPALVALEATHSLAAVMPAPNPGLAPLWTRLVDLAPDDADVLLPATEALVAAGHAQSAKRPWRNLKVVAPMAAERALRRNGALKALDTP